MENDLYGEMRHYMRLLDAAVGEYPVRGKRAAEAERAYRIALAEEELTKRAEGIPATLVRDVARGQKDIAKLAFERDCALRVFESAGEAINSYKLQLRLIASQLDREWGDAK